MRTGCCRRSRNLVRRQRPVTTSEHRKQGEQTHLQEDVVPATPILAAMQLVPQRAVEPRQPDQPEHNRELDDAASGDVCCEMVGRAPDQDDVDEVVEQLEEADVAFVDDLAVTFAVTCETRSSFRSGSVGGRLGPSARWAPDRRVFADRLINVVGWCHCHIFASGVGHLRPPVRGCRDDRRRGVVVQPAVK